VSAGTDAKQNSCDHRDGGGDDENGAVDADLLQAWHGLRADVLEQIDTPDRERDADRAARYRQEQTFDQHLAHDRPAACAERDANREFAFTRRRSREQHRRQVRASNEQHKRDSRDEDQQHWPHRAGGEILQRQRIGAEAGALRIIVRILGSHLHVDRFDFGLRGGEGRARLQSRDEKQATRPALFELLLGECERRPEIGALGERSHGNVEELNRKLETLRHHSDDGAIAAVE
jgi:hypothetical protein